MSKLIFFREDDRAAHQVFSSAFGKKYTVFFSLLRKAKTSEDLKVVLRFLEIED